MKKFLLNLLALGFFLVSCNPMSENKLVVVTCADNPPFEYIKKGEIVGFDIDLIKEIGRKLGKEVEIQNIDFSGLILALMNNRVEVAIAALSPTPARAKYVDFTKSYMEADMAALFRDNLNIQNEDDLKSKILGAQFGSTWADYARQMVDSNVGGTAKFLPNSQLLVQELLNTNVDIVILEQYQAVQYNIIHPELRFFILPKTSSSFSIAVRKKSPLTEKINKIIHELDSNGFIMELKNKWF